MCQVWNAGWGAVVYGVIRALAVAAGLGLGAASAHAQARFDFDKTPGLLPKTVLPERYALSLTLDPQAARFEGEAMIELRVREPVAAIVLHAHELTPGAASLRVGTLDRALRVQMDGATQTWRLLPLDGAPIGAGLARLSLAYQGVVQTTAAGLYRAHHAAPADAAAPNTPTAQTAQTAQAAPSASGAAAAATSAAPAVPRATMLATQLQAVFARKVFPAFDEPAFRSIFELTVRAPQGFEVLANMPLLSSVDEGVNRVHRFAPTPPMPAYLFAVAVGRFDSLSGLAVGSGAAGTAGATDTPLRIVTAPGKRAQGAVALAATQQLLPYFSAYFGQPFSLPKLDQLAVPSTRDGAMEDWGLISYAEGALLFDPERSGESDRRRNFDLIAHEVSHQWFGNLVTAASWEEIWLNEAFATWMATKATHHFNPGWQTLLRARPDIDRTMARDAGPVTRAIRSGAVDEGRVFEVFDNITYTKGGAVLGMLEEWMGEAAFKKGLVDYMAARRLSNATAGDLWHHMAQASGEPIASVAASWTDQPGFPLVQVASRCVKGQTQLELRQSRFLSVAPPNMNHADHANHAGQAGRAAAGGRTATAPATALWQIPVVLRHGGQTHRLLLRAARMTRALPGCASEPLLVNPGGSGFYRVAYDAAHNQRLQREFAQLPSSAQVSLLSDRLALADAGLAPLSAYLELLAQLPAVRGPSRPALYDQARAGLGQLAAAFAGTPVQAALHRAARALLAPELASLGWQPRAGEDSELSALRSGLIRDLARYGDAATLAQAAQLFDADEAARTALAPGVRAAVLRAAGYGATAQQFAQLRRRLLATNSDADRWVYASALAATPDPALARELLALSLEDGLPNNVAQELPGMLARHYRHPELAYSFSLANWPELQRKAGNMWGGANWLLPDAADGFSDPAQALRLQQDQARLLGAAGAVPAARVAAQIEQRARMQQREVARAMPALQRLSERLERGSPAGR